jgi:hypothetical protein
LNSHRVTQEVRAGMPKRFHNKLSILCEYLNSYPNLIRVTPSGRAIVAGKELQRGNILDIMRSLYIWPKSQALPSGVKEVIEAFQSVGAPSYLMSNSNIRPIY